MMTTTAKTTTDSSLGPNAWRPRRTGAAIGLMLLIGACGTTTEPTTTSPAAATVPPTTVTTTTTTAIPPDPGELLTAALAQYAEGYEFTATTVVNDQEATVQTGRWLDGASAITVQSGDGEVEYIITPTNQWVRLPAGEWEEIDAAPSVSYPLESMTTPDSLDLIASTGDTASVRAVYSAAAMGLSGDPVDVVLDFADGVLVGISFTADVDGNTVESATRLRPPTDTTPITAPTT